MRRMTVSTYLGDNEEAAVQTQPPLHAMDNFANSEHPCYTPSTS